ncbi:MAG: zinc-binding dehydrogenase [Mycobacteriales bacterium]
MLAVMAIRAAPGDPLAALRVGDHSEPGLPAGWLRVRVKAASINRHDLWTLEGVGVDPAALPIVLGCDAAGVTDDGRDVVVHAVIGDPAAGGGDETLDPDRTLLSERYDGTFAEWVAVPERNVIDKPRELSWEQAGALSTAWLTAYRMVFNRAGLPRQGTLLVQGAGGGVSTAAIQLAAAAGHTVYATSRSAERLARAVELGAIGLHAGERLPERVDAVIETVGAATWDHSLKSLRPGGTIVVSGATSGANPPADLARVYFRQLRIVGSTMGTRGEYDALLGFLLRTGVRPVIDSVLPLAGAAIGLERVRIGDVFGKIVLVP